jgi:hypothetical protein
MTNRPNSLSALAQQLKKSCPALLPRGYFIVPRYFIV